MSAGIVAVDELARAYQAAVAGEFRSHRHHSTGGAQGSGSWSPSDGERLMLVAGCGGGSGTSTVALALVEAAGHGRVVECCTCGASGLAAASTAELGATDDGWVRGSRGALLIEHRTDLLPTLEGLPAPTESDVALTVVDHSGDTAVLLAGDGWLSEVARAAKATVLVARPTVPGLRRLETAIGLFGEQRVQAVLVGVGRRIPRPVERALGPLSRRLLATGRLHTLPHDPALAFTGPGPDPLPAPLLTAAAGVLASLEGVLA